MNEKLKELTQADALQVAHGYDNELARVYRERDQLLEVNKRLQAALLQLTKDVDTLCAMFV